MLPHTALLTGTSYLLLSTERVTAPPVEDLPDAAAFNFSLIKQNLCHSKKQCVGLLVAYSDFVMTSTSKSTP